MFTIFTATYFDGLRIIYSLVWLYLILLYKFFIYDKLLFKVIIILYVCTLCLYLHITVNYTYEVWNEYYLFVNHSTNSLHNLAFSFAILLCLKKGLNRKYRVLLFLSFLFLSFFCIVWNARIALFVFILLSFYILFQYRLDGLLRKRNNYIICYMSTLFMTLFIIVLYFFTIYKINDPRYIILKEYFNLLDFTGFLIGNNSYVSKIYGLSNINPHSTLIKFHQICGLFGLLVFFVLVFSIYLKTNIFLGSLILTYFLFEDYTPGTFGQIVFLSFFCSLLRDLKKLNYRDSLLNTKQIKFERSICS